MEVIKVNKGNDIKLELTLHEACWKERINDIRQVRCLLVQENYDFMLSHDCTDHCCDPYRIHNCGPHVYNVLPCERYCICGKDCEQIEANKDLYNKDSHDAYRMFSKFSAADSKINAFFPACDQYELGEYTLLVEISLYEQGWGKEDLRWITVNCGVVFELVNEVTECGDSTVIPVTVHLPWCNPNEVVPVSGIYFLSTSLILQPSSTSQIKYEVKPSNATDKTLTWSSSNEEIATVSQSGKITTISEGSCVITATSVSNPDISNHCNITVKKPEVYYYGWNEGKITDIESVVHKYTTTNTSITFTPNDPMMLKVQDMFFAIPKTSTKHITSFMSTSTREEYKDDLFVSTGIINGVEYTMYELIITSGSLYANEFNITIG